VILLRKQNSHIFSLIEKPEKIQITLEVSKKVENN
jgi:hypothetical protein